MERHLAECVEALKKKYDGRVIFVGCYGSQNYGLAYEGSDYDFKAVIVPSFEEIVHGKKMVSTTIELRDGLCDVKDIRLMMNCWKKQNVNFVELLFTKHRWVNSDYEDVLTTLFDIREEVVHYDEKHAVDCIRGMMMEKYNALFKPYPSQRDVVERYGYAAKQLSHIWRLRDLGAKYVNGNPYVECLVPVDDVARELIAIKTYEKHFEDMDKVAESAKAAMDNIDEIFRSFSPKPTSEATGIAMDGVTSEVIRIALKSELIHKE